MSDYCEDHDPLILVGRVDCPHCGVIAWPTEAEWVDERLILVVYTPGCGHLEEYVLLVDPALIPQERRPEQCASLRKDGEPCRGTAAAGTPWCSAHGGRRKASR